ncbi:MAG: hypothetical protein ACOYK9_03090 [Chlamydiia bacterium]
MKIEPNDPNQPTYKQEFKDSVELFDKSFQGANASDFDPQKRQYYKAMEGALNVMQDSANGMAKQHLVELKQKLAKDTHDYIKHPTQENQRAIEDDLHELRKEAD